jgi:ABC-type sugar transport system ATPase subunit
MDTPDTRADGIPAGGAQARQESPALQLTGLLKRFGDKTAVDQVDLTVPRGSFFGLVGPNGAGKTTSLSMAVRLLQPDGGTRGSSASTSGPTRSAPSGSSASCPTAWPCRNG